MNLLELRVFWGKVLLRVDHVSYPWRITIGQGRGVNVFVATDDLPSDSYELVRSEGERCVVAVAPGMSGEIERSGGVEPLTGTDYELEPEGRTIVCWGGLTFAMRFVPREAASPRFAWRDMDHEFLRPFAVSLCGHVAAIVTMLVMPYATQSLHEDFRTIDDIVRLLPPASVQVAQAVTRPQKKPDVERPVQAPTLVRPTSHSNGHGGAPRFSGVDRFSHLLDGMSLAGRGESLARNLADVIGARAPAGTAGLPGLGLRGPVGGFGSPFTASRDVGLPTGDGPRRVATERRLGDHHEHGMIVPTTPEVSDALPREVIRAVVDRNRAQIRYCYERELQRDQDIEGRVVLKWIVAATGLVVRVDVTESTVPSRAVGDCLREQVARWRFPEPAGGGVVTVSYPFVFRAN